MKPTGLQPSKRSTTPRTLQRAEHFMHRGFALAGEMRSVCWIMRGVGTGAAEVCKAPSAPGSKASMEREFADADIGGFAYGLCRTPERKPGDGFVSRLTKKVRHTLI